jgi:hypothetical protein
MLREKVEDLKRLLLQGQPVMIFGADFTAFNYGDSEFAGGRDSIVTSGHGHARINRESGAWSFKPEPNVPIREASHFNADRKNIDLTFTQLKEEVEKQ